MMKNMENDHSMHEDEYDEIVDLLQQALDIAKDCCEEHQIQLLEGLIGEFEDYISHDEESETEEDEEKEDKNIYEATDEDGEEDGKNPDEEINGDEDELTNYVKKEINRKSKR